MCDIVGVIDVVLQVHVVFSWHEVIGVVGVILGLDIVVSWDDVVRIFTMVSQLHVLMLPVVMTVPPQLGRAHLSILAFVVLVEETGEVAIWRQLGVVKLFMSVVDSLDVLGSIDNIWVVRRDIVVRMSTVDSLVRLVQFPPATLPVLVTVGVVRALEMRVNLLFGRLLTLFASSGFLVSRLLKVYNGILSMAVLPADLKQDIVRWSIASSTLFLVRGRDLDSTTSWNAGQT